MNDERHNRHPEQDPAQNPPHPGAAFGIPEGATGEEVVDAVFGETGIDPELLPYLEASGTPVLSDGDGLTVSVSELQETGAQRE